MTSKRAWKRISNEQSGSVIEAEDSEHDAEFTAGAYVEPKRKRRKMQATGKHRSNLIQYFGDSLNYGALENDPSSSAPPNQDMHIEDSDETSDYEHGGSLPVNPSQARTHLMDQPSSSPPPPPQTQIDNSDSTTESETEAETEPDLPVQRALDLKIASKDSITESESDGDFFTQSQTQRSTQQWQSQRHDQRGDDGDATATETESEDEHGISLQDLRPSFPRRAGQSVGPLVLDEVTGIAIPGAINTFLREYQRDGVRFFYRQYQQGKGALLGDDMGKTIQVISFLSALMGKTGSPRDAGRRQHHVAKLQDLTAWRERRELPPANETWPTALIVAPSTVVGNWEREFNTWGYFEVGLYTGFPKDREQVLKTFKLGRLDIMITSFETARNDVEHLNHLPWTFVFVDEAHRLKNSSSTLTRALTTYRCRTRIALTGTAIQNSYAELWTLLDWTNPGEVGTYDEWRKIVEDPLKEGQSKKSSEEVQAKARLVSQALHDKLLPQFWLRRTKDIIKDQLPKKFDHVVFCPLTKTQRLVYRRVLALEEVQRMILKDDPCGCGSNIKRGKCCHKWDKADLLRFLDTLIKISNHLCLILPYPGDTREQIQRNRDLADMIYPGKEAPKYAQASMEADLCGKWIVLQTLLEEWREDPLNKVLIFTKSVKLLTALEFHLKNHGHGILRLDGTTKQSERMPMIDRFHADPNVTVFLISTQAGGVGLNLTGANRVVIFDPNWNPAHDLQAMDRAYRFGQTRDVYVYRLLGAGSIEEIIYARQLYKQQQMAIGYDASVQTRYFEGIQKGHEGELFGLKNMFRLQETDLVTKRVIEKAHVTALDWALENIQPEKLKENWVYKAESSKSVIDRDLGGLGALLLDDNAVPVMDETTESHRIDTALREKGIKYHHCNDQVLVENPVERQRATKAVQNRKPRKSPKRKQAASTNTMVHQDSWPPRRVHQKTAPVVAGLDSGGLLLARRYALQALGYITDVDETTSFAEAFAKMSQQEQEVIIAKLDDYTTGS